MITINSHISELEKRITMRSPSMVFVELKSVDGRNNHKFHALVTDYNDTGVTLHTYLPVPIGTQIEIKLGGTVAAIGEVTNLNWDNFDENNRIRLGVEFIEKNDNWFLQ